MVVHLLWPRTDSIWYMFTCGTLTYYLKLQWLVKTYTPKSNSWLRPCPTRATSGKNRREKKNCETRRPRSWCYCAIAIGCSIPQELSMVGYMLRRATALSVLGQRAIINYVIRWRKSRCEDDYFYRSLYRRKKTVFFLLFCAYRYGAGMLETGLGVCSVVAPEYIGH